jgi:hypothetical protein
MLLEKFVALLKDWQGVFPQQRTWTRAVHLGIGLFCGLGRRTLTRSIFFRGREQQDWSADYKVFSRSPWEAQRLFDPVFSEALPDYCSQGPIAFGLDDTAVPRTGKKITTAFRQRDPMSPPFRANLMWGQRFMQASLLLPLYEQDQESSPRALPVRFKESPVPKKPGRKATEEDLKEYKKLRKEKNLSSCFVETVQELRTRLDEKGYKDRQMIAVGDGSYCNKRTFTAEYDRTILLTRCRKNLRLRDKKTENAREFQPLDILKDQEVSWQKARIFYAGSWREIEYKEMKNIFWERAGKNRPLRLFVIKPIPYQKSKNSRKEFREEAFLLCTDPETLPAQVLLQKYFDRWEIEVNHRDEKSVLGVGHAQVWNQHSVGKVPEFLVAMYSLLLLASLQAYGPKRTSQYRLLPKWRHHAKRPSCLDLVTLLRSQLESNNPSSVPIPLADYSTMVLSAAA